MARTTIMRIAKLIAGFACLVIALLLPGLLALGIATNFGFGRESPGLSEQESANLRLGDVCLASPFALCAVGLVAIGLFLIVRRHSPLSRKARALIAIGAFVGVAPALSMVVFIRSHAVDQAEDRRRWIRGIDAENAKSGFIKDTNGDLIYVGVTNSQAPAKQGPTK